MNYTWGQVQLLAVQKMFLNNKAISVDDLPAMRNDRKYAIYLNAMPDIANEGLIRLMSVGNPLIKTYKFTRNIPDTIYSYKTFNSTTIIDEDYILEGDIDKAYYFEANDNCTVEIQAYKDNAWVTIDVVDHVAEKTYAYEAVKGLIDNADNLRIRYVFKANGYMYEIRNIAFYRINFRFDDDIYAYTPIQKYDMSEIISDFYQLISVEYEHPGDAGRFDTAYYIEGDKTLCINSNLMGSFIIKYKAYPDKITSDTDDSYTFTMPPEMIAILPLYIASELYKDDDISVATIYRNEFEVSLSAIRPPQQKVKFADTSGWL